MRGLAGGCSGESRDPGSTDPQAGGLMRDEGCEVSLAANELQLVGFLLPLPLNSG